MAAPINADDYRDLARRRLPRMVFDYLEGGACAEDGLAHNIDALGKIRFVPRRLVDVSRCDPTTELFGRKIAMPLVVGPTGLNGLYWRDGDICLARAAAKAGVPFALSTASNNSIEEIAAACDGDHWFQLYILHRDLAKDLVQRALNADYSTLVLTTDVTVNGYRERDLRNGFGGRMRYTPRSVWDGATHPAWSLDFLRRGPPALGNLVTKAAGGPEVQAALVSRKMDASFSWDDLKQLRDQWPRKLIVKGILSVEDAKQCEALGVDAVALSNHGGRQLDHSAAAVDCLPNVAAAVDIPVIVDGGFRRGSDIVKARALGAQAVLLGRAPLYALAAKGEEGVVDLLRLFRDDIERTLALIGCPASDLLTPEFIERAHRSPDHDRR